MKYVLAGYGSRGDVEPVVVIGAELAQRGHEVRIAVPPNERALAESAGLDPIAYGPDSHAQLDGAAGFFSGHFGNPLGAIPEVVERATQVWLDKGTMLAELADGCDVIVAGMNEQRIAANVAEHLSLPLLGVHFFPPRLQPGGLLHTQLSQMSERPLRRSFGLPDGGEPPEPLLEIQAYDERCLPGQPQQWAEAGRPFAGALTLQSPARADVDVLSWIDEGTAPVYFGMGSTPIQPPADIVDTVIAACTRLHERLLICAGPNDLSGCARPDNVKVVSSVNHAAVLPACRAVIHHGGAGTTAAALRAGVPSVILWLWLDQPIWGAGVEQLNVGVAQSFSDVTEDSLVGNLSTVLAPECRDRARRIAEQMMSPAQSAACAADMVEAAVGVV